MDEPMDSCFETELVESPCQPNPISTTYNSEPIVDQALSLPTPQPHHHPGGDANTNSNSNDIRQEAQQQQQQGYYTPLLRPGSMVMMSLTEEDYKVQYWPKLKTAIDQLLNMKPMSFMPISYEQMYSCVYKCVCKQFSERLYNDLLSHLSIHMEYLNSELESHEGDAIQFITTFSFLMHQYLHALSGIVPIFNYMNRFYVENKLKTDLNEELRKLFRTRVVDVHIDRLINLLDEARTVPFAVPPPTMASIMKNLYALNKSYSELKPTLFSRYLPNILPASDPTLLDQYARKDRDVQGKISNPLGIKSHNSSRKREYEDDTACN